MDVGSKGLHMLSPPGRPNALPEGGGPESRPCFRLGTQNPVNFFQLCGSVARPIFQCGGPESRPFFQFGSTESRPFFQLCGAIFRPFFQCEGTESRPIFQFGAFRIPSNFFVQFFPLTE